MDPITMMLIAQGIQTTSNFIFSRKAQKQTLQKLHTNRLVAKLNGEATANQINDIADETLANNITIASTGGYAPMDSASFNAIQERVETTRDKDISMNKISTNMAVNDINNSLKNLKDQMLMSEINLVTDMGSIYYSHKNYTKNKGLEEAYRAKQLKILEEQTKILKNMKTTSQLGYKKLLWRTKNYNRYQNDFYGKYRD
tara:strand:- start:4654 stop:5253 length:600 start_codon:yes stop_codon:yes gene_type:complete